MSDTVERLRAALDKAEAEARDGCSDAPPGWVLRFVQRDRGLLADHQPRTFAVFVGAFPREVVACSCSPLDRTDYTPYPCREVRRAAECWLSQEGE